MAKRHLDEVDNYDYLASNSNLPEVVVTAPRKRNILQEWWDDISSYNFGKDIKNIFKDSPEARHMVEDLQSFGLIPTGSKDKNYSYGVMPMADSPIGLGTKTALKGISNAKSKINFKQWTPEQWTAAQDAAIARGDMAEAQRLRDLHFKVSAPNNKLTTKLYHGTDSEWNSYDPTHFSSGSGDLGAWGKGLYLSGYKNVAERYGKNIKSLYAYARNPLEVKPTLGTWYDTPTENAAYLFNREKGATQEIKDILKGKDAVNKYREIVGDHWITTHEPYEEVVIPDGRKLKLADAVTYDNNGVRIPLGKRDNFNINDIRYALIPSLLGGVTAGYLYNNNNNYKFGGRRSLKTGGAIYIKPENRGKFNATKERTGKTTEELTHSKNPLTRKRAIFAQNAAKWKH